jgi:hypothetical protein
MSTVVMAALLFASAHAAQEPVRGAFVTRLGKDTLAVERYQRTVDRLEGEIVSQYPRAVRVRYTLRFDEHDQPVGLELFARATGTPDAPPLLERRVRIDGATIVNDVIRNGAKDTVNTGTLRAAPGALPYIQNSMAIIEELVRRFVASKRDTFMIDQFVFGPQGVFTDTLARARGDTIVMRNGATAFLRADSRGRLLVGDARATTVRTISERVPDADLAAIERRFTDRGVVGILSPRDTAEADIGGAKLWVDYGRPSVRGRTIFGDIVEWGQVWRAGANAATQFRTSTPLAFGHITIPAGTYTLWIIPDRSAPTLIVNRQIGQWGTQYDSAQDLARIPIRVERLTTPVEQLVADFVTTDGGGELRFAWEAYRFVAPFRVRGG